VHHPVDRDDPQDDRLAERLTATRQLDLRERRKRRVNGNVGTAYLSPRIAAQASNEPATVREVDPEAAIFWSQQSDLGGGHDVAAS
jgi:hypothetical protein